MEKRYYINLNKINPISIVQWYSILIQSYIYILYYIKIVYFLFHLKMLSI